MKQRILSALIALIIVIPIILIGGGIYRISIIVIGTIGMIELLRAKDKSKKIPTLIKGITIYNFLALLLMNVNNNSLDLIISPSYVFLNLLSFIIPLVLYNKNKDYTVEDAGFLFLTNILLALSFSLLMILRDYNIFYLLYLLIITISSDTFAYLIGNLIGRHEFAPKISPKKTIEGFVGGLILTTFIGTVLYISGFDYNGNIFILILGVMFLSVASTIGDLMFSIIKRHFKIKDYGKIMPGHGGVLDRLDSLLFVLIVFYLITTII